MKEKVYKVKAKLNNAYSNNLVSYEGVLTESQIENMKSKIGTAFIIGNNNCSINLQYFSYVFIESMEEVNEDE